MPAERDDDLLVIARTDARDVLGLDEALRRCRAFKSAGADMVFMHSPQSLEDLKALAGEIDGPHIVCIGEGEFTDAIEVPELFRLGFLFGALPSCILRTAVAAVSRMLSEVRKRGHGRGIAGSAVDLEELNAIVGIDALRDFETEVTLKTESLA